MVRRPMRPSFRVSPRLVMPTTSEVNTTGTIIILIRLMNIVPIGAIHHLMNGRLSGPATRPATTDKINAIKILYDKFTYKSPSKFCTTHFTYYIGTSGKRLNPSWHNDPFYRILAIIYCILVYNRLLNYNFHAYHNFHKSLLTYFLSYARIKTRRKGKPVARTDGERGESLVPAPAKSSERNH